MRTPLHVTILSSEQQKEEDSKFQAIPTFLSIVEFFGSTGFAALFFATLIPSFYSNFIFSVYFLISF
jgi:hypothetical protein